MCRIKGYQYVNRKKKGYKLILIIRKLNVIVVAEDILMMIILQRIYNIESIVKTFSSNLYPGFLRRVQTQESDIAIKVDSLVEYSGLKCVKLL